MINDSVEHVMFAIPY